MFKKILIENRGEIALRVIITCKEIVIKKVSIQDEVEMIRQCIF